MSSRTLGIELEGYGLTTNQIRDAIVNVFRTQMNVDATSGSRIMSGAHLRTGEAQSGGQQIVFVNNDHTHHGPTFRNGYTWQVMADSSVGGMNNFELVSPVLYGARGEKQAAKVIRAVMRAGAKVNTSCGLHITLGTNNSRWNRLGHAKMAKVLHRLCHSYSHFHGAIGQLLAPSRRQNGNGFAHVRTRDVSGYSTRANNWYKYEAINLSKMTTGGCIEYRQHQGSFNAKKVLQWARLLRNFQTTALNEENADRDHQNFNGDSVEDLMDFLGMPEASRRFFISRRNELSPENIPMEAV